MKKIICLIVCVATLVASSVPVFAAETANGWVCEGGKYYWYEDGVKQGTANDSKCVSYDGTVRGREIYDPSTDAWYWLDADNDGARATNKEVFIPYVYQNDDEIRTLTVPERYEIERQSGDMYHYIASLIADCDGKWVRYDENGKMVKGWYSTAIGTFTPSKTDDVIMNGDIYYYDYATGAMMHGKMDTEKYAYTFGEVSGVLENITPIFK